MKEDRLDLLLHALFEESLEAAEREELNALLTASPEARARYRRGAAIHSALVRKAAAPSFFEAPAVEKITPFRRSWLAAAAVVALLGSAAAIFALRPRGPMATVMETKGVAWAEGSPSPA